MVKYDKLWKMMKKRGVSQYRLIKYYGISAGQIDRLKKSMHVSTRTLEKLCHVLSCKPGDLIEFVNEPVDKP